MLIQPYKLKSQDNQSIIVSRNELLNGFSLQITLKTGQSVASALNSINLELFEKEKEKLIKLCNNKRKSKFSLVTYKGCKFKCDNETLLNLSQLIKHTQGTMFKTADDSFVKLSLEELKRLEGLIIKMRSEGFEYEATLVNSIRSLKYQNETSFEVLSNLL